MSTGSLSLLILSILGIVLGLFANLDQFQPLQEFFKTYFSVLSSGDPRSYPLFTKDELANFNGKDGSKVYLAILGDVFDVSRGKKHYGEGGGYSFFSGKDGSRAFVTGDFTVNGLIEDTTGLSYTDLLGLEEWNRFYKKDYKHIGRLIGLYYDQTGQPTHAMKNFENRLKEAKKTKLSDEDDRKKFPPCNFESRQGEGRRIWCSNLSGGVQRDWIGVPRQYFQPGKSEPRCACVKDTGPPSGAPPDTAHTNQGDLDNPLMKLYEGCPPDTFQCYFED